MREIPFQPRARLNAFAIYGLAGFVISLVVHVGTYADTNLHSGHPLFWILHIGIFPLFFAMIAGLRGKHESETVGKRGPEPSMMKRLFSPGRSQFTISDMLRPIPTWVRAVFFALAIYVGVNFALSMTQLPEKGSGGARTMFGKPVDPLNVNRYEARLFSGHWLIFYLLPALHFLYKPRDEVVE